MSVNCHILNIRDAKKVHDLFEDGRLVDWVDDFMKTGEALTTDGKLVMLPALPAIGDMIPLIFTREAEIAEVHPYVVIGNVFPAVQIDPALAQFMALTIFVHCEDDATNKNWMLDE